MVVPNEHALLRQIADLVDAADGDATDTEALAAATGRATFGPPWFAMDAAPQSFAEDGLLEITPVAPTPADDHARPAPPADRYELRLTPAGAEAAARG